jgi:tRNA threonylcarbamoyladenosine biosynthesis protein TsaB
MAGPLVLALDGSTRLCSAALVGGRGPSLGDAGVSGAPTWEIVTERSAVDDRGQAKVLLRMVDEMLRETGRQAGDLDAVVVGVGPGTFTGVRIAVATARAVSLALAIPVAGVSTLAALASAAAAMTEEEGLEMTPRLLLPVVDARRNQLFFGLYERVGEVSPWGGRWRRSTPYGVCERGALREVLAGRQGPAMIVAEDRDLVGELADESRFASIGVQAARLILGQERLEEAGDRPHGTRLAGWLADAVAGGLPAIPELVKPIYLRSPDADIHILKMKDPWGELPLGSRRPGRG